MFTNTLVYGFYDAKMIFIEPMITRAYLLADPDDTQAMQVPQKYPEAGRYPTGYRVWRAAPAGRYRIELLDFVTRN